MNIIHIFLLKSIRIYQIGISPWIGKNCRYIPTCSNYMIQSLTKYSLFKAILISLKRIFRCNPWGNSGYDPIK
ncbi:membrane protein insertion efficiency factor YidD [Blattabacterium sp. (Cryptocercus kyebangensis)]|uniref:membrane protein insertion efficiency factor YidD n=1 Tax=Blattabacterium sp. (Cryptocercus kyebangensis) TaxID=298656 RepID=UPI000D7C2C5C|nr:membrane protein insertion efficiency factor YidD [Blattabacterium sp. (Cryptocercus kyebangensis)]AWU43496.1 membrane protein insertion efficiency factor YidD [Blattabacterium sp. (Cryptocercus kyebangensis)]